MRADDLTFADPAISPTLCELAERGAVFTHAVSGSSWTLPAHAQMFTGQPPQLHGVQNDERRIDPLTRTLPECLASAGYATVGFWSGWFLARPYGFGRGFDRYEGVLEVPSDATGEGAGEREDFVRRENASHRQITSQRILDRAREALAEVPPSEPLFLFGHFFDPHYDYIPPAPFDTRFDPDYAGDIHGRDFWLNERIFDPEANPPRRISDRDLAHVRALYRGEIAWTESVLRKLFDLLEANGRLENALVIVTADHGEEFFEHGNRGHRQGLYEEVLRVPLLVVRTGEPASAREVDELVSLSDLMPTILDAVDLTPPRSVWGRSLMPFVEGESEAGDPRFVVSTLTAFDAEGATLVMDSLHARSAKLIRQLRIPLGGEPELTSVHWFDLDSDPGERQPRRDVSRPEVAGAWRRLEGELARMREFYAGLEHSEPAARHTDVREIFQSELGALGYAEASTEAPQEREPWTLSPLPPVALPVD